MNNIKKSLTKAVLHEVRAGISKKSTGTKIAESSQVIDIIVRPVKSI